jgi:transcriptional regulator with GAF, ATPase, and Fis domain
LLGLLRRLARALWTDPITRRRGWILLAGCLICVYSLAVLAYSLTLPEIGVRSAFTPVVNFFYRDFLYPEDQEPLRQGDRITELAGQPVETWSQLLRRTLVLREETPAVVDGLTAEDLRRGRVPPGVTDLKIGASRVVRVGFEREGEEGVTRGVVWCRLGRTPLESLAPGVLWFCLNIGLFVVGAIVFWKRPEDAPASLFFLLCLVTLGAFMGGYHWSRIVTHTLLISVFMVCAVLLPGVTLHFYLVFPRPKAFFEVHRGKALAVIYGPLLVFLGFFLVFYEFVRLLDQGSAGGLLGGGIEGALRQPRTDPSGGVRLMLVFILNGIYLFFGVAALLYLGSIASLAHSYRAATTPAERNQVKWILIGSAAALVPLGYVLYMAICQSSQFGAGGATWWMFAASACVTLAYTFSITRYRLLELDQLVSSGAVYFLISFLAGLIYYGVVFAGLLLLGSQVVEAPPLSQVLGVSVAALVLMVTLDLVRGRLMRVVDKHLRREKYQLDRTLQRMSQAIEKLVDPPRLARQLLHTTAELLSAPSGAIYLRQGEPALYRLTDSVGEPPPLTELSPGCPLIEALRPQKDEGGRMKDEPERSFPDSSFILHPSSFQDSPPARQLAFLKGVVAQALFHEGQLLGLLVLGARPDGPYTAEDLQILSAFAQITVLALLSAEGHRTIEGLNRDLKGKVEKIAEQQRRILALQSQLRGLQIKELDEGGRMKDESEGPSGSSFILHPSSLLGAQGLVGSSPQVQQLLHLVRRVAASSSVVLLRGESGTGKELLARALHENSPRAGRPFVKVHCAALSAGLLESELFGHVKGAFTSAIRDKVGRFEAADGGTLFLDEIGDISLEVQTKLLRVLEEMTFERVGSSEPVQVDVRIIAATHRDLEAMIAQGKFREDLYFRLNVLPIRVPPLRERAEDVAELAQHFLGLYAQRLGKPVRAIDDDALAALKAYPWPGNVRQLENVIERACVIAEGPTVGPAELPPEVLSGAGAAVGENGNGWAGEGANGLDLPQLARAFQAERAEREKREREQLVRALAAAGGNKAEAARALGVARSTLISRLKKFGLS